MSLTEEDVKRWYDRAKKWGRAISAETCKDTLEYVHDLSSFLKRLEKDLSEKVDKLFFALFTDYFQRSSSEGDKKTAQVECMAVFLSFF